MTEQSFYENFDLAVKALNGYYQREDTTPICREYYGEILKLREKKLESRSLVDWYGREAYLEEPPVPEKQKQLVRFTRDEFKRWDRIVDNMKKLNELTKKTNPSSHTKDLHVACHAAATEVRGFWKQLLKKEEGILKQANHQEDINAKSAKKEQAKQRSDQDKKEKKQKKEQQQLQKYGGGHHSEDDGKGKKGRQCKQM